MANPSTQPATEQPEPNWKTLRDYGSWRDLLQSKDSKLDNGLRRHIIHYGQMTAAIVDLFGMQPSPNTDEFFAKACLVKGNPWKYDVKAYINTNTSEWIGYVAVSNDQATKAMGRRDIFVGWRGTRTRAEWIQNLYIVSITAEILLDREIKVHEGFYKAYTYGGSSSLRDQVKAAILSILDDEKYQSEEISITVGGFSLGGAIATLNAMDMVANDFNKNSAGNKVCPVTAFTFGAPSVFIENDASKKLLGSPRLEKLRILRITNRRDPVPKIPFGNLGYGQVEHYELKVDHTNSRYFKGWQQGRALEDLPEIPNPPDGVTLNDHYTIEIKKGGDGVSDRDGRGLKLFSGQTFTWFEKWFDPEQYFCAHNMDVYMHGVKIHGNEVDDAYDPEKYQYHDIALVNKFLDRLKTVYGIPAKWWGKNGNMVQLPNGNWKLNK